MRNTIRTLLLLFCTINFCRAQQAENIIIITNSYPPNPHVTVLEFLARQPKLKGKVAAFGAWEAFDRILNEQRSK